MLYPVELRGEMTQPCTAAATARKGNGPPGPPKCHILRVASRYDFISIVWHYSRSRMKQVPNRIVNRIAARLPGSATAFIALASLLAGCSMFDNKKTEGPPVEVNQVPPNYRSVLLDFIKTN